jgi:tetratricopeptide (TPR) repeat protein
MLENLSVESLKNEFKSNKKARLITYIVGGLIVLILGYFLYRQFIWKPANLKSQEAGYVGLNYASMDSTDLAIDDLRATVKKYDGKQGGEVAQFVLGRQYMEKGEFKKALKELEDVDVSDTYIKVDAVGLQGDCHSEMKNYKEAVELYLEASEMETNDYSTPKYLFKAALLTELKLKDPKKATEWYQKIKDNYLQFGNSKSIDKYLARAQNKTVI